MPTAKPNSNSGLAIPLYWRRYVAVTAGSGPNNIYKNVC